MADLSDADLAAIVRANEHPDCCRFIPVRSLRAAIAADRELNAAPSVVAGGLPLQAAFETWAADQGCHLARTVQGDDYQDLRTQIAWDSWQACAALASRPAVDAWQPIETAPKDGTEVWAYNGEQARMKWIEGDGYALWAWADEVLCDVDPYPEQPTHWLFVPAAPNAARHPAQRENT